MFASSRASSWHTVAAQQGAIVVAFLAFWEAAIAVGWGTEFFFGRPSRVFAWVGGGLWEGWLVGHTWVTLYEELAGFVVGTVLGTAIGLGLWWSRPLALALSPVAVVLNATPKIVMAPIFIVWFGIGVESKVVLAVSICAIVAWISAFDAIRSVDLDHVDMVRALGGGRWDTFTKIVVPTGAYARRARGVLVEHPQDHERAEHGADHRAGRGDDSDREGEGEPGADPDEREEREHADDQSVERWKRTQHEPLLESRSDDA